MSLDDFRSSDSEESDRCGKGGPNTTSLEARKKYRDEDWLRDKILGEGRTRKSVANELGVSRETIQQWCERFDIESAIYGRSITLSGRQYDALVGNLMGDGSVTVPSSKSGRYQHSDTYSEYLEHLTDLFPELFCGKEIKKRADKDIYYISSLHTQELKDIRNRWYPDENKTLPDEFYMRPAIMKYWYICDGSLEDFDRPSISARWLDVDDIERIIDQLSKDGFDGGSISIKGPDSRGDKGIRFKNGAINDFFDYIGSCPVDCYSYKWP